MYKKYILIISLVFFSCLNCFGQNSKHHNDLSDYQLNGKVKSLRSVPYHAITKHGKMKKGSQYDALAVSVEQNIHLKFNEEEQIIEYSSTFLDKTMTAKYVYDNSNRLSMSFNNGAPFSPKTLYFYDSIGNKIEERMLKSDGTIFTRILYEYDTDGNLITEYSKSPGGNVNYKKDYEYDNKRNRIGVKYYKKNGHPNNSWAYEFNGRSQCVSSSMFDSAGILQKGYFMSYNTNGYISKDSICDFRTNPVDVLIFHPSGKDKQRSRVAIGKHDAVMKLTDKSDSVKVITFEYKYDIQGNWIQRIEYQNGQPEMIVERKIKYYK